MHHLEVVSDAPREGSSMTSGYSHRHRSYMSRINEKVQDNCPLCHATPHDTAHLFSCSANPTELTVTDLWTKPKEAAEFLKLDEDDNNNNNEQTLNHSFTKSHEKLILRCY